MRIALGVVLVLASCSRAADPPPARPAPVTAAATDDEARATAIEEARAKAGGDRNCHYDDSNIYGGNLVCDPSGSTLAGSGDGSGSDGQGKYVFHGSGSLGQGSGEGIGYGDVGHGSGTGDGFGSGHGAGGGAGTGMRPRTPGPTISLGQPTIGAGGLDPVIVRRYLKRNFQKLQYCYERALLAKPGLAGTVVVTFTVSAEGPVTKADATGVDPDVSSCMAMVIKDLELPKAQQAFDVRYPIEAKPK